MSDWGKGHLNNNNGFGQANLNNTNGFGSIYHKSNFGDTKLFVSSTILTVNGKPLKIKDKIITL